MAVQSHGSARIVGLLLGAKGVFPRSHRAERTSLPPESPTATKLWQLGPTQAYFPGCTDFTPLASCCAVKNGFRVFRLYCLEPDRET